MTGPFDDSALGLVLKGYSIVPNAFLEQKIAIYTPEIVETILQEHPEIVDRWLQKLHAEYISKKRLCDFESDPVACFNLATYEKYEKDFKSWDDGGLIAITLPRGKVIRVSKNPLISLVGVAVGLVCSKCSATFTDLADLEKHSKEHDEQKVPAKKPVRSRDNVALNTIWRLYS